MPGIWAAPAREGQGGLTPLPQNYFIIIILLFLLLVLECGVLQAVKGSEMSFRFLGPRHQNSIGLQGPVPCWNGAWAGRGCLKRVTGSLKDVFKII